GRVGDFVHVAEKSVGGACAVAKATGIKNLAKGALNQFTKPIQPTALKGGIFLFFFLIISFLFIPHFLIIYKKKSL
ncbi:QacA/B family quaternary ammonium compound efflux MFS transporter, partial [Staphylococcus aureus]|nr:QacA/B family quaternary ammonium compound efflux MFS transporter [Staphylococcus aureus]